MSSTRTFTISNNSTVPVQVISADISPSEPQFSATPSETLPHILQPGDVMTVDVAASSASVGFSESNLVITHDGLGSPYSAPLSANFIQASVQPDEISGLQVWYDASQIAGLINNDPVTLWEDLSINGYDAALYGLNPPTFKVNSQNGLPGVEFISGSLQGMETAPTNFDCQTLFVVAKILDTNFLNGFGISGGIFSVNASFAATGNGATTKWDLSKFTGGAGVPSYWLDGQLTPDGEAGNTSPHIYEFTNSLPGTVAGQILTLGLSAVSPVFGVDSIIYEVAFYDGPVVGDQREGLLNYFSEKWGIVTV